MEQTPRPAHALLLVTRFDAGGVERHVLDLAAGLRETGLRVTLAGSAGKWMPKGAEDFLDLPLPSVTADGGGMTTRARALLSAARGLRRFLGSEPVHVMHAHEVAPAYVARLASWPRRIPLLMSFHGCEAGRERHYASAARRAADWVATPALRTAAALSGQGYPADRIDVIRYGLAEPPAAPAASVIRAELGIPAVARMVVTVARLHRQKGVENLVDAAALLRAELTDLKVVIVGDGPDRRELELRATEAGLRQVVIFVGHRDDARSVLRAADLFVLPSRWEALPISIMEAFQAGVPVIATDVGGVTELVDDTVGALVPPGDPTPLAAAMRRILTDSTLREKLAANALARSATAHLPPAEVAARHAALYRRLVAERHGSSVVIRT